MEDEYAHLHATPTTVKLSLSQRTNLRNFQTQMSVVYYNAQREAKVGAQSF